MIEKEKEYEQNDLQLIKSIEDGQLPCQSKNILVSDLETEIMKIITQQQQKQIANQPYLKFLTQDLEIMLQQLENTAATNNSQQILQTRMHQLAVSKLLVFTHGKSDFRLVIAHFALGRAYLQNNCYQQAVSHLTIASTKVSKMGDIKETKIYNSYILTALARCYLSLEGYSHSLQLLSRAYDIQSNNQNIKGSSLVQETLELLARVYLKIKLPKDAIKISDKLIDLLQSQFIDFEGILKKLKDLQEKKGQNIKSRIEIVRKKGGQYMELIKPFQTLAEKLQFLIIEYDRKWIHQMLPIILKDVQVVITTPSIFESILRQVESITDLLIKQLKRMKIFKFKIYLESGGQYLTNSIDLELKSFLKEYHESVDRPTKALTHSELTDVYKLLVHYCIRFSDHDTQLQYLNSLQNIFSAQTQQLSEDKLQLLRVKRNIAMIYNQKRMAEQTLVILKEIKELEKELFGKNSETVKKTNNMIRIVWEEGRGSVFLKMSRGERPLAASKKII